MRKLISIWSYIEVLKPRETSLLTFIGVSAAIVAAGGYPRLAPLSLALVAILLGSGGCNGLTNYLDREVDARMRRTCRRALPSKRIDPPERMLPFAGGLVIIGLVLAWLLDPLCFLFGAIGTIAALTWRKRVTCVFQGTVAGCAPVLIGYLAISHRLDLTIAFLCILIAAWIPLHVWSIMLANREDYLQAGISYFPLSREINLVIKVLLGLAVVLLSASIGLFLVADFGWLYLGAAVVLGILMIYSAIRLLLSGASRDAWRVYKLSAFPYLGLIFLAMCVDIWVV